MKQYTKQQLENLTPEGWAFNGECWTPDDATTFMFLYLPHKHFNNRKEAYLLRDGHKDCASFDNPEDALACAVMLLATNGKEFYRG